MTTTARGSLLLALLLAAACTRDIGDECQNSVDCDPNGTRMCDLSQPGGYCTIAGCDERSCPKDSACIRYFPVMFLSKPCNPQCEDYACSLSCDEPDGGACLPPCVVTDSKSTPRDCPQGMTNDCSANELCLDVGLCARTSLEKRNCAKTCDSNDDCRGGYQCRPAGLYGSMLLSGDGKASTKICAPALSQ